MKIRPCRPRVSHAASDAALPERSGSTGCDTGGWGVGVAHREHDVRPGEEALHQHTGQQHPEQQQQPSDAQHPRQAPGQVPAQPAGHLPEQHPQRPRHDQDQRRHHAPWSAGSPATCVGDTGSIPNSSRMSFCQPTCCQTARSVNHATNATRSPRHDRACPALELRDAQVVPQRLAAGAEAVADHQRDPRDHPLHVRRPRQQRGQQRDREEEPTHHHTRAGHVQAEDASRACGGFDAGARQVLGGRIQLSCHGRPFVVPLRWRAAGMVVGRSGSGMDSGPQWYQAAGRLRLVRVLGESARRPPGSRRAETGRPPRRWPPGARSRPRARSPA